MPTSLLCIYESQDHGNSTV